MKTQRHNPVYNQLEIEPSENPQVKTLVSTAARTLVDLENRLNALDAKVGDGDTGSTFAEGAREIIHLLEQGELPLNNTAQLLQLVASGWQQ